MADIPADICPWCQQPHGDAVPYDCAAWALAEALGQRGYRNRIAVLGFGVRGVYVQHDLGMFFRQPGGEFTRSVHDPDPRRCIPILQGLAWADLPSMKIDLPEGGPQQDPVLFHPEVLFHPDWIAGLLVPLVAAGAAKDHAQVSRWMQQCAPVYYHPTLRERLFLVAHAAPEAVAVTLDELLRDAPPLPKRDLGLLGKLLGVDR